jgi:NADPH-dependent 2,4-dienoyl-CoA reductase/sulfur reductase-like enzyme
VPGERSPSTGRCNTSVPGVFAAGDCVVTYHRLLGETYLSLGTTAQKQGRVAGEDALGGHREHAGSLGTQVVKVFEHAAARTGLRGPGIPSYSGRLIRISDSRYSDRLVRISNSLVYRQLILA